MNPIGYLNVDRFSPAMLYEIPIVLFDKQKFRYSESLEFL